jgi:flagellar hook-associated protein 1 FlgK
MTLMRTLNVSAGGLHVSQAGLQVVGNNIANVDVDGYSRQRIEIEANDPVLLAYRPSLFGQGASLTTVSRANDDFLERQVQRDQTEFGFFDGRAKTLDAAQRLFGGDTSPDLGGMLDAFFNAARELSQEPDDVSARRSFIQQADNIAQGFNVLDRDLRTVQRGVDDALGDKLAEVNRLAKTIAEMNARIVSGELDERNANDFRDAREQSLRELSRLVPVNPLPQPDGALTVELQGGSLLVQGDQAARLQGTPNALNQGLLDIEHVGINGQITNLTAVLTSGEVGGLVDVRDNVLGQQLTALDTLAFTFASAVNAQHAAGFGLDGLTGRALFLAPVPAPGTAANLSIDPLITGNPNFVAASQTAITVPGDNRNMQAIANLQNLAQAGLGNVTFNRSYGQIVHQIGLAAEDNSIRRDVTQAKSEQSEKLRASVEGVSIDDEMIDLTRFQKHFEANSRVVTTVNQLLDSILQLIR